MVQSVGRMPGQGCIPCVGNQTLACAIKNAVTDVNNIASTLIVNKSQHVSDSAKNSKSYYYTQGRIMF